MAIVFADGITYDYTTVNDKGWYYFGTFAASAGNNHSVESSGGRFSRPYLRLYTGWYANGNWNGGGYLRRTFGGTETTIITSFSYTPIAYPTVDGYMDVCTFREATLGSHCYLRDNAGFLEFYNASGSKLGEYTDTPLTTDVWYSIQVKVTIHDSSGAVEVKVNGVTWIDETSIDTKNQTNGYCNQIQYCNTHQHYGHMGLSDIIIMDTTGSYCNDFLGDRLVTPYQMTGDGTYSDFTASDSGGNWSCIDEIPPNEGTDKNTSSAVNDKDTFDHEALADDFDYVSAVVLTKVAQVDELGSASIRGYCRSNGTDQAAGETTVLGNPYHFAQSYIYVDPDDSAAWTKAKFDAAEFGYERNA